MSGKPAKIASKQTKMLLETNPLQSVESLPKKVLQCIWRNWKEDTYSKFLSEKETIDLIISVR